MSKTQKKWIYFCGLAVVVALLPLVVKGGYYLLVLNIIAINGLVVLGLNLLIGFAGQISLGHAAFFGMGAYFSAIFTAMYNTPQHTALANPSCGYGVYCSGRIFVGHTNSSACGPLSGHGNLRF